MTPKKDLFELIKSLNHNEKGYFKKYSQLHSPGEANNYLRLFEAIDAQTEFDEDALRKKFKKETFINNFWVAKKYLYDTILKSLRAYNTGIDKILYDLLLDIKILFEKGMYEQAKQIIKRGRYIANKYQQYFSLAEFVRWQMILDNRDITNHPPEEKLQELFEQGKNAHRAWKNSFNYLYLSSGIIRRRAKGGFARSSAELKAYHQLMQLPLLKSKEQAKSFEAQIEFHTINAIYIFNTQFANGKVEGAYNEIKNVLALFAGNEWTMEVHQHKYIQALQNQLTIAHKLEYYSEVDKTIKELRGQKIKNKKLAATIFYYTNNTENAMCFSPARNTQQATTFALQQYSIIEAGKYPQNISDQESVYIYTLGSVLFTLRQYKEAAVLFNKVLSDFSSQERNDFRCMSRILLLLTYFETQKYELLDYSVNSTYKYLSRKEKLYKTEDLFIKFFRKFLRGRLFIEASEFSLLKQELNECFKDPTEQVALRYFNFLDWPESKIKNKSLEEVIRVIGE